MGEPKMVGERITNTRKDDRVFFFFFARRLFKVWALWNIFEDEERQKAPKQTSIATIANEFFHGTFFLWQPKM